MLADQLDIILNYEIDSLAGTVTALDTQGLRFTHIAFSGYLPLDYGREVDLYAAVIDNVQCDCVILDIAQLTIPPEGVYSTLAFLLGLVVHSRGDVAFVVGTNRENRRFIARHFGTVAAIHASLAEITGSRPSDSLQVRSPPTRWSDDSPRPQKFS